MFLSLASFSLWDAGSPWAPLQDHLRGFPRLPWELLPPVWPVTGKMLGQGRGRRWSGTEWFFPGFKVVR